MVLFGFPEGFYKTKNTFEKTKNTKTTNDNQKQSSGKPTKTMFLKVSDPPLDMGLFLLLFCFPEGFYKTKHLFEKTTNTKENQRKQNKLSGKPTNILFKGFRPTLGYVFFVAVPNILFVL